MRHLVGWVGGREVGKNQYRGGGLPKAGRGLGQFADLRGLGKKERGCF